MTMAHVGRADHGGGAGAVQHRDLADDRAGKRPTIAPLRSTMA
jgi:hypothetical protein